MFVRKEDRPRPAKSLSLEGKIYYSSSEKILAGVLRPWRSGGTSGRCFFLCEEPRYMGLALTHGAERSIVSPCARTPFIIVHQGRRISV